jgi:hypothetical protein
MTEKGLSLITTIVFSVLAVVAIIYAIKSVKDDDKPLENNALNKRYLNEVWKTETETIKD